MIVNFQIAFFKPAQLEQNENFNNWCIIKQKKEIIDKVFLPVVALFSSGGALKILYLICLFDMMKKIVLQNMELLAKIDGNKAPIGEIKSGLIQALVIATKAYGVHAMLKQALG